MDSLLSNKKLLYAVLSLVTLALLSAIVLVGVTILKSDSSTDTTSTKSTQDGSSSFSDGTVSNLSGGVSSYRNIKGLTLRVNQIETCSADTLTAYVSVSSTAGNVNTNFGKNDVSVYLDGKKMTSFEFSPVNLKAAPLRNMLLLDHSGSMTPDAMANAKTAGINYVSKLQPDDQAGVIQFNQVVETLVPLTKDKARVSSAINGITPRGDTAIFDAIGTGIDSVAGCGRKAVTVLTDGEDTASKTYTQASVTAKTAQNNLPVFAVGIKSPNFDPSAIRDIAEKSGGLYLEADTPANITSLYDKIDGQLRGQFVANFKMPIKKTNTMHTLKIVSTVEGSDTGSERVFFY